MNISLSNLHEYLPFVFIIVGVLLVLLTPFLKSGKNRQKKTMQLLSNFNGALHEHDIAHWKEIYRGTREGALAPAGHFINHLGKPVPLVSMWTSGSDEHIAIQRMAENVEVICVAVSANTVDVKMIWTEIGQLMEALHDWLEDIPGVQEDMSFLEEQYPYLRRVFIKYGARFKQWPCRSYV
jgi:hypothetical protein